MIAMFDKLPLCVFSIVWAMMASISGVALAEDGSKATALQPMVDDRIQATKPTPLKESTSKPLAVTASSTSAEAVHAFSSTPAVTMPAVVAPAESQPAASKPTVLSSSVRQSPEARRQTAVMNYLRTRPERQQVQTPTQETYVLHTVDSPSLNQAVFMINDQEVFRFRSSIGFLTPYLRAKQVGHRLALLLKNTPLANSVEVRKESETLYALLVAGNVLTYADAKTAVAQDLTAEALANRWAEALKQALHAYQPVQHPRWKQKQVAQKLQPTAVFKGMASWYGPGFHGHLSADGSRFNQQSMTAAHRTLPFGTLVRVTNLTNHKSCVVKITDRGPFVGGRLIDVSKGAAAAIGLIAQGVARVQLEVLH